MFRIKISTMLTLVILMVMAVVYFTLPTALRGDTTEKAQRALKVATLSMERYERLNDFSVMARAEQVARFGGLREALQNEYEEPYEYNRHLGVFNKGVLRWKFVFKDIKDQREGRQEVSAGLLERAPYTPDLFIVTDDKGMGVAALGRYEWYKDNVAKRHPSLMSVSDGVARKDIWFWKWDEADKGSYYQVGIAPVMQGPEKMTGVVVIGRQISNASAKEASASIEGHGTAYFANGQIVASTLQKAQDDALTQATLQNLDKKSMSADAMPVTLDGQDYLASVRPFSGNADDSNGRSGFIVFHNVSADQAIVSGLENGIFIVGLGILLLLLVSVLIVIRSFVKPFEEIDQGIQEVLAGNKDYTFQITGNYPFQSEMAHSLNLMSAYLQGKRMPDEEDEETQGWGDFMIGEVTSTAMMRAVGKDGQPVVAGVPEEATPATAEPADKYKKRVFAEYVQARKNLGMDTADLTLDAFTGKLDRHAEVLRQKHKAREVRFSVVVREGKVVLKPQPIF